VGDDPASWLSSIVTAAEACGFAGLAVIDHLIQIPQVGTAWDPIPEPLVPLGLMAGQSARLRLGTLVSPVTPSGRQASRHQVECFAPIVAAFA